MNKTSTFSGGIHPPGNKSLTLDGTIQIAALPSVAVVPLVQHIGAPAECLVSVGDLVEEEQIIGKASGFVSANIHSPIPGKVVEIKDVYMGHGPKAKAVCIELSGEFSRLGKDKEPARWDALSVKDLLDKIQKAGVVGLGGATFPSHVKFSLPQGKSCDEFIINAVECESYLASDHKVMCEHTREVVEGIRIIQKVLKPKRTIIGIEKNKMDAALLLEEEIQRNGYNIEITPLKVKYPQGAEKNLIKAVTGKEVPSGKLPLEVGVINANVSTCFAVYEAVVWDKPLVERTVTMSGKALKEPKVFKVRIGTPIKDLVEECGGLVDEPVKIVSGGPMMGSSFFDLNTPVIKSTSGVLLLTAQEVKEADTTACLSCGRCLNACPMGLNPTGLYKFLDFEKLPEAIELGLMDCVECGSCSYVCPAHIPLVSMFKIGRAAARRQK